jgi:anti-sigma B factor antagonist
VYEDTTGDEAVSVGETPVKDVAREGDAVIVRLAGELDLYNAPAIREALERATRERPERVVVDLGEVVFLDSTALGVLIDARGRLERGDAFVLAAPGVETRRTLHVSGLDRHFAIADTVEEALTP